ncbi:MAG: ribosome silencing factor [Rectinema sp.]|nr:ribosome silencing factor [Rectinema sp.]
MDSKSFAWNAAGILVEHKAADVIVMDIHDAAGWADYFVIATSQSSAHMRGLYRHLEEFMASSHVDMLNRPEMSDDQQWLLIDTGGVVVHIMHEQARRFYDLESLWFNVPKYTVLPPTERNT